MRLRGPILVLLVIAASAVVTGLALHLLAGKDDNDVGVSVTRDGITVTLQGVEETRTGTDLVFLVGGVPADNPLGDQPVDILADQRTLRFNARGVGRARVSGGPVGPHEVSLRIGFDTSPGTTGVFEIGRIYVRFSESEEGGEDGFVEGPWSFKIRTPEGPYD